MLTGGAQILAQARSSRRARREKLFDELAQQMRRLTPNATLVLTMISYRRGLIGSSATTPESQNHLWTQEFEFVSAFWTNLRGWNLIAPPHLVTAANSLGTAVEHLVEPGLTDVDFGAAATEVRHAIDNLELSWLNYRTGALKSLVGRQ